MHSSSLLLTAVRRHLDTNPRTLPPRRLVVAVSGGADSVALLRALHAVAPEYGLELVVAHLDHGLRGPAAAEDAAFVAALAATLGLPARIGHADVAAEAAAARLSLEDAARRARRRFLVEVATDRAAPAGGIALGHTRDDQAETVLLNLLRGAGPRGLAAMQEFGPDFFMRPLMRVTRAEARAYLESLGQPWREDASNLDPAFTRNRIRNDLLPRLAAEFNPAVVDALAGQAELFADIDALLVAQARAWVDTHARPPRAAGAALRLPLAPLEAAPRPLRAAIWRAAGWYIPTGVLDWERPHFEALDHLVLAEEDGQAHLPGGVQVRRVGAYVWLIPAGAADAGAHPPTDPPAPGEPPTARTAESAPPEATRLPLSHGAEVAWDAGLIRVTHLPAGAGPAPPGAIRPPDGRRAALFDARALAGVTPPHGALVVRPPRPGERMSPFGSTGRRSVVHLLADAGVPTVARARAALVVGEKDEIVWIPGVARSGRAPVGEATGATILLEWFGPLPWQSDDLY